MIFNKKVPEETEGVAVPKPTPPNPLLEMEARLSVVEMKLEALRAALLETDKYSGKTHPTKLGKVMIRKLSGAV